MTDGHNPFEVDEGKALSALSLAWGDSYEIYITDGQWQAWHDNAPDQDMLTGTTPDELNRAIRADFARREATGEQGERVTVTAGDDGSGENRRSPEPPPEPGSARQQERPPGP